MIKYSFCYILAVSFLAVSSLPSCNNRQCNPESKEFIKLNNKTELLRITDECNGGIKVIEQEIKRTSKDNYVFEGEHREYYPTGEIKLRSYFKNGLKDSIMFKYFRDGNIEMKKYFAKDVFYGPQQTNFPNGNPKLIVFQKNDTVAWFSVALNQYGSIYKTNGIGFKINANTGFTNLKKGEALSFLIEVPIIEKYTTMLQIRVHKDGVVLSDTIISKFGYYSPNMNAHHYYHEIDKEGKYKYDFAIKILDSISKKSILENSLSEVITVN